MKKTVIFAISSLIVSNLINQTQALSNKELVNRAISSYKKMETCTADANNFDGIKIIRKEKDNCLFEQRISTNKSVAIYQCEAPLSVMKRYSQKQSEKVAKNQNVDTLRTNEMYKYCQKKDVKNYQKTSI